MKVGDKPIEQSGNSPISELTRQDLMPRVRYLPSKAERARTTKVVEENDPKAATDADQMKIIHCQTAIKILIDNREQA